MENLQENCDGTCEKSHRRSADSVARFYIAIFRSPSVRLYAPRYIYNTVGCKSMQLYFTEQAQCSSPQTGLLCWSCTALSAHVWKSLFRRRVLSVCKYKRATIKYLKIQKVSVLISLERSNKGDRELPCTTWINTHNDSQIMSWKRWNAIMRHLMFYDYRWLVHALWLSVYRLR